MLAREKWNLLSENGLVRAVRLLRSKDPGYRSMGSRDLKFFVALHPVGTKEVDEGIPVLLAALRDQQPAVRKAVADSLFFIVSDCDRRSLPVPRAKEVAAELAEALNDTESDVRRLSALSLYFTYSSPRARPQPLPEALDLFLDLLGRAIQDSDEDVRICASQVLTDIAP
jgi:hypothetical protein